MIRKRTKLVNLPPEALKGDRALVAGRLIRTSQAALTLEDESERRTFGLNGSDPGLRRLRSGDILEIKLQYKNQAWRVDEFEVIVPCMLSGQAHEQWLKKWFKHRDGKCLRLKTRAKVFNLIRKFFEHLEFMEVETPTLVKCAGMEPHLFGFETKWDGPDSSFEEKLFLPTSPEFHMKQMLVLGYEKIFQLARAFRNKEYSSHHQPEFTMLEWYRAYSGYEKLMEDTEHLCHFLLKTLQGGSNLRFHGKDIDLKPPWNRISVKELFKTKLGIDIETAYTKDELLRQAKAGGYDYFNVEDSFEDVYFKLFLTELELKLGWDRPVILYDYPIEMAALSRRKPGSKRFCERFEVYIAGIELANAFGELNNAREQAQRFLQWKAEKRELYGFVYEPDADFLKALEFGMPPASGIALGVDRLIMLLLDERSIDEVIAFPHVSPIEEELDN